LARWRPFAASAANCSGGFMGSLIMTNQAAVSLRLPITAKQSASFEYGLEAVNYRQQPAANDAFNQSLDASYSLRAPLFTVKAYDRYQNTDLPAYNPNNVISGELVSRDRRYQNTLAASLEYPLAERLFSTVELQWTTHKYVNPSLATALNHSETTLGLKQSYHAAPRTRPYIAVRRRVVHYSAVTAERTRAQRAANHKDWDAVLGVEGDLSARLKGTAEAGFHYQGYDADDLNNNHEYVVRTWQAAASLDFRPTPRDRVHWTISRGVNEAVTGGRWYVSSGVSVAYDHTIRKVTFGVNGAAQIDRYAEAVTVPAPGQSPFGGYSAVRRDDLYSMGLRAEYRLQEWLTTWVSYQRRLRNSIFTDQFNYVDNQTSWTLKVSF
jgi:hypothetical protein